MAFPNLLAYSGFHKRAIAYRMSATIAGIAALVCVATLALDFVHVFRGTENMAAPAYGTASAPYSDALDPWLGGGLSFLFDLTPPTRLYRPTIGVFWGSVLAMSERVDMIPILFSAWFFAIVSAMLVIERNESGVRYATIAWLAISALSFTETLQTLYVATANVDLAAFVFTLSGVILLLWQRPGSGRLDPGLLAAAVCLGVAAAVRGPMLLAGPFVIVASTMISRDSRVTRLLVAGTLFSLPLIIDGALQRQFGVTNNGLVSLFCVYSDSKHAWTPGCHDLFLVGRPSAGRVLQGYLNYVFSWNSLRRLAAVAAWRTMRDLSALQSIAAISVLFAVALVSAITRSKVGSPASEERGEEQWLSALWRRLALFALVASAVLMAEYAYTYRFFASGLILIVLASLGSAYLKHWRAFLSLGAYLLGTLFLCLLGLQDTDRYVTTFSFTLPIGLALLIIETRVTNKPLPQSGSAVNAVAFALIAALAFLYLGSFLLTSDLRTVYTTQVYGRAGTALKISDDARIDRSLYYTGDRQLIYTRYDGAPIGSVRRYQHLLNRQSANNSFLAPNGFIP